MNAPELPTIFALSSGQPPAAIAVIRISGSRAFEAARSLTTRDLPEPRRAVLRRFVDPESGELLDEGLLICARGPNTETGEDIVELQGHGSLAAIRDLEAALARLPGLRLAQPGEFTRRAFLNGRMDLAEIEGLGDLLAAETALQRRAAMAMMGGALSRRIAGWTLVLRRLAAQVEARLDFSDEGDVMEAGKGPDFVAVCAAISADMEADLARPSIDRLRDGVRVAIGGPPNAGKSSLFNHLVGREAAIVSPHAGTTRDIIEASISLGGIPIVLSDSAGLREGTVDEIERMGIDRAQDLLAGADIILWLGQIDQAPQSAGDVILVRSKSDLGIMAEGGLSISIKTGEGVDSLIDMLCNKAQVFLPLPGDYALSRRQHDALTRSANWVGEAAHLEDDVIIGECLRQALGALDELTGRATTDAVLDELFSGFCIGK